jgi:hypothetical protein
MMTELRHGSLLDHEKFMANAERDDDTLKRALAELSQGWSLTAWEVLYRLAEAGSAQAQYELALVQRSYGTMLFAPVDADTWMQRAAAQGLPAAILDVDYANAVRRGGSRPHPPLPVIYRGHSDAGFFAYALTLPGDTGLIDPVKGNVIPESGPYVCIVPTLSFHGLIRNPSEPHRWHYSDLEREIIADLRSQRALLVFDLCNEGPAFYSAVIGELYRWLRDHGIPQSRCVWLSQNRAMERSARAALGPSAEQIAFLNYDFFIKMTAWRFAQAGAENPLAAAQGDFIERLFLHEQKDRLLLCLNATPRHHRILALAGLDQHGYLPEALYSFPGLAYVKPADRPESLVAYLESKPALRYLIDACRRRIDAPPVRIDDFTEMGNELVFKIDPSHYLRTYFSLVTETEFSEGGVERVTEKTAKAFSVGHPTIVMGNPHSFHFMTDLGFQSWAPLLESSYDAIVGNVERFLSLMDLIGTARDRIRRNPDEWLANAREIGRFNHSFAKSGRFLLACRQRLDEPVTDALWSLLMPR